MSSLNYDYFRAYNEVVLGNDNYSMTEVESEKVMNDSIAAKEMKRVKKAYDAALDSLSSSLQYPIKIQELEREIKGASVGLGQFYPNIKRPDVSIIKSKLGMVHNHVLMRGNLANEYTKAYESDPYIFLKQFFEPKNYLLPQ